MTMHKKCGCEGEPTPNGLAPNFCTVCNEKIQISFTFDGTCTSSHAPLPPSGYLAFPSPPEWTEKQTWIAEKAFDLFIGETIDWGLYPEDRAKRCREVAEILSGIKEIK